MARSNQKYTATGKPIPLGKEGHGLKIDPKTGQIITVRRKPEPFPRKIRLETFSLEGDENEVLARLKSGGGPNSSIRMTVVTRKRYSEIIDRIMSDESMAKELAKSWRIEATHFLKGAEEPQRRGWPNPRRLQYLCDPDNESEAALILAFLGSTIESQVVELMSKPADLEPFEPIERELANGVDHFSQDVDNG